MDSYINYISESGISLGILTLIYIVFLRKETFFNINRFYLVISSLFSALLPLITFRLTGSNGQISSSIGELSQAVPAVLETVIVGGENLTGEVERAVLSINYIGLIYLAGVLFMTLRFGWRFGQLWMLVRSSEKRNLFGVKIVRLGFNTSPFSFFRWLFVGKDFNFSSDTAANMIKHELIHIRQHHSVDVLLFEVLTIFQWFNPFIWFLRLVIRENHEFIADSVVAGRGASIPNYKSALLHQVAGIKLSVANNFNYSMLKTRFRMISKIRSPKSSLLKYLSGALAMVILVVVFACETNFIDKEAGEDVNFLKFNSGALIIKDSEIITENEANRLNSDSIVIVNVIKSGAALEPFIRKYGEDMTKNGVVAIISASQIKQRVKMPPKTTEDGDVIFFIVEDMPEFPGGDKSLREYISQSVKYPLEAKEKGIEGKIFVNFVVGKDGKVGSVKIARGADPLLDNEAIRVVKSLPMWKPGKQKGKAVNVSYTIPINFSLSPNGKVKNVSYKSFSIDIKKGGGKDILINKKEANLNEVATLFDNFYDNLREEKRSNVIVRIKMDRKSGSGEKLDKINKLLTDKDISQIFISIQN